jgi:hypothetical protein
VYPAATLVGVALLCGTDPATVHEPVPSGRPSAPPAARGDAAGSAAEAANPGVPGGLPMLAGDYQPLPSAYGIPSTVLDAYRKAAAAQAQSDPACRLDWTLLAGIGKVESGHARGGDVAPGGEVLHPILGPVLDGSAGNAAVPNSAGARWDQGGEWSRAVGPMQFLPSTWARWGAGGNPENVYDASAAAARYLCSGGGDLGTPQGQSRAIYSYNHSASYVALVQEWMRNYQQGGLAVPDRPGAPDLSAFQAPAGQGQDVSVQPQPQPAPATPVSRPAPAPPVPPAPPVKPVPPPVDPGPQPQPQPAQPVVDVVQGAVGAVKGVLAPVTSAVAKVLPGVLPPSP